MQRRVEVVCCGRGRGGHPPRLIATLTDSRRVVGPKADFVEAAAANMAEVDRMNNGSAGTPEKYQALALGLYDLATRLGYVTEKTRLTSSQRGLHETRSGLEVEEKQAGRYFHLKCRSCNRRADVTEVQLTLFVDALLGRVECDLEEISSTI